jgi:D-serine deaminase-like pyridoxal phosphate-dependent protein
VSELGRSQAGSPSGALSAQARLARYGTAFAELDAPFAFVDLDAMWSNSDDMLRRARGKPIRVASKSVRCRALLSQMLERDAGYQGLLCFTLPEALWLAAERFRDLVVAYPTADRAALRTLAALEPERAPVVMVDSLEQLDLIDRALGERGGTVSVCLDFDASFWLAGERVKIGPKRTPVHTPAAARQLAEAIAARPRLELVGMMCYEGHIAGQGDIVPGNPLKGRVIRRMQRASYAELRERRAEAVRAVSQVSELRFVNAGGTGDLERVANEPAMTEATAGSGFYAPGLFDHYTSFDLQPAAIYALPVVRRPGPGMVTALGGGYPASGAAGRDRLPTPYLPPGLRFDPFEAAGEVQTPLRGSAADALRLGDKVYLRHAKAGELCERFDRLYLVSGSAIVDEVPTYRGEGRTFL